MRAILAASVLLAGCQYKGPAGGCTHLTTEMVRGGKGRQAPVYQRTGILVPVLICAPQDTGTPTESGDPSQR